MSISLNRVVALSRLVAVDGLRRNALLGLTLLALGLEVSGLFFFAFVPRDIGRISADFVVTIGWLSGMLFLLFHAVQVMSWGEDRRVIHTLLARPLSRTEYVLGVYLGLLFLLFMINVLLGGMGYAVLALIKHWVGPNFFSKLGIQEYLLAWFGVISIEAMILSAIVLFSGMIRGSFTVLLLTVSYYLICYGLPVAMEFMKGTASNSTLKLLIGLTAVFPNYALFDYKGVIVALNKMPSFYTLLFNASYSLLYCAVVLTLAAIVYNRRDIK